MATKLLQVIILKHQKTRCRQFTATTGVQPLDNEMETRTIAYWLNTKYAEHCA